MKQHSDMVNSIKEWLDNNPDPIVIRQMFKKLFPCQHTEARRAGSSVGHIGTVRTEPPKIFTTSHTCCHYFSESVSNRRGVRLLSGSHHLLPDTHTLYETDACIFCQEPEERK